MVEISPFSALSNLGQASNDRATIAENFDTFLTLLTTQLKNQNPLDPLDMNQFTQQLVQFTEVEQTVKLNENFEQMVQLAAANTITSAVGYIGKEVTTSGSSAQFKDGRAAWTVTLAADSPSATFTVKNESGVPVYTRTGPVAGGSSIFTWDGQTDTGAIPPEGTYTLSIVAEDGDGGTVSASTAATGIVDGVDMSGDEPVLLVGGWQVRLEDIQSINAPATSSQ
jgi:flagellar basal-body rod modification protein FlgD